MIFTFFFLLIIKRYNMHGYIRKKWITQLCKPNILFLLCKCYTFSSTAFKNCTYMLYDWRVLVVRWLFMPNLGFSSLSRQKEWFKTWKIKDQPNHTNHMKESQSSHCLVVHEDAHLSYKSYKVKNFVSKAIQGTQVPIYTNTHYFCIFQNFSFFY